MMRRLCLFITSVLFGVLLFSPLTIADIQGECGKYLAEAMDIGVRVQELKAEKRELDEKIDRENKEMGDWSKNYRVRKGVDEDRREYIRQRDEWLHRISSDRDRSSRLKREIISLERDYERKASRFAECVEKYKRNLRTKLQNREVSKKEYDDGIMSANEALQMLRDVSRR